MDKIIVTALLIIVSVIAALVVIFSLGPIAGEGSEAASQSQSAGTDLVRTRIEMLGIKRDIAGTQIDAWVKNMGMEPIRPVSKADVVVTARGTRFDAMTYNTAGGDSTWTETPAGSS